MKFFSNLVGKEGAKIIATLFKIFQTS